MKYTIKLSFWAVSFAVLIAAPAVLAAPNGNGRNQASASRMQVRAQVTTSTATTTTSTASSTYIMSNRGAKMSADHRSEVSIIVQKLLFAADRTKGIGQELKAIVKEEATTTENQARLMEKIENRNGIATFLIGTDYKNVGALRSEMVTTENHMNQLKDALARATTTDTSLRADLITQISSLEAANAKVDTFIATNENKFSLFGWIAKLFNR